MTSLLCPVLSCLTLAPLAKACRAYSTNNKHNSGVVLIFLAYRDVPVKVHCRSHHQTSQNSLQMGVSSTSRYVFYLQTLTMKVNDHWKLKALQPFQAVVPSNSVKQWSGFQFWFCQPSLSFRGWLLPVGLQWPPNMKIHSLNSCNVHMLQSIS